MHSIRKLSKHSPWPYETQIIMRGMHFKEPYILSLKIVIIMKNAELRRQVIVIAKEV